MLHQNIILPPCNQTSKLKHAILLTYVKTAFQSEAKLFVTQYSINGISSFILT